MPQNEYKYPSERLAKENAQTAPRRSTETRTRAPCIANRPAHHTVQGRGTKPATKRKTILPADKRRQTGTPAAAVHSSGPARPSVYPSHLPKHCNSAANIPRQRCVSPQSVALRIGKHVAIFSFANENGRNSPLRQLLSLRKQTGAVCKGPPPTTVKRRPTMGPDLGNEKHRPHLTRNHCIYCQKSQYGPHLPRRDIASDTWSPLPLQKDAANAGKRTGNHCGHAIACDAKRISDS